MKSMARSLLSLFIAIWTIALPSKPASSPSVSAISPASESAGGPDFTLNVYGSGFSGKSLVLWNGSTRPTTAISPTYLIASIASTDIAAPGTAQVSVVNRKPFYLQSNSMTFSIVSSVYITSTGLPNGIVGTTYSATLSAAGGAPPYSWSLIAGSLPTPLTLSPSGAISGTPTASGFYTFTVQATDSAGQRASQAFTVSIVSPFSVATTSLPNGTVGVAYSATLSATGGTPPYTWSLIAGSLPTALTLTPLGAISGTPAVPGAYTFTLQAIDSAGQRASQAVTLSISSLAAFPVWVSPSLVRVGPTDAPGTTSSISLSGARGEYVDTQIIVRAPALLTNVNVTVTDLVGPGGAVISKSNYNLYREYYVTFSSGSLDYGSSVTNRPLPPGTYPDPLIPFNDPETGAPLSGNGAALQAVPFNLAVGLDQPIWVDLFIPRGATNSPPGTYTGNITVTSALGNATVPVSLTVWNFELPLTPSEKTSFAYFSSVVNDSHYQRALLRHKIVPWLTNPGDAVFNVSTFGMNRSGLPFFGNATCSSMSPAPSVSTLQASAAQYPAGLPLDVYPADEIGGCTAIYPTLKQWAQNAHAAGVKVLITMSPDPALYDDGSGTGKPAVDVWAMLPWVWKTAGAPGTFWSYND